MLWVVQKNLYNENRRGDLIQALRRLGLAFVEVDVHDHRTTPDIPPDEDRPIITNGSIMLSAIATQRGWWSGRMMNDGFDYGVWSRRYDGFLLNGTSGSTITTLGRLQLDTIDGPVFVRPVLDNKSFNGKVFQREALVRFVEACAQRPYGGFPSLDTEVMLSRPKTIGQEHRHYIVDGEVITSSRYKLSGTPNVKEGCDGLVLDRVHQAIATWTPSRAFVLDTYIAGDEVGIVEIGGICHAGLYEADLMRLVHALDSMPVQLDRAVTTGPALSPNRFGGRR